MADPRHGVAVVGLAGTFPGAPDVAALWRLVADGRDAFTTASEARIPACFEDASSTAVDRLPTRRGGFLPDTLPFDAGALGIMPVAARGAEPDQLVALQIAAACLDDLATPVTDRGRVAVILGRGAYLTPGLVRLDRKVRQTEQLARLLADLAPEASPAVIAAVRAAWQAAAGDYGPDTAIGLVPNLAASRIANRLDLGGPAYTVDAACASALLAVEHGVREVRSGRCDLALAGAVHLTQDVTFWSVFAQLGALSRAGQIRPFDRRADGLLIGEGAGLVALKRLDHAERDGDRIYAVIRGVGSASDGRATSVMVPRVEGQVAALQRAWADAARDPSALTLLEAHGTGTPAGDRAELATIAEVFGADGPRGVLGTVKANIGHAMPAAGIAGLIKAVLAVHHGVLPPSPHCEEPSEGLARTRFDVLETARPWEGPSRVAAVSAFGFGGINAHVVLDGHGAPRRPSAQPKPADREDVPVLRLAAADPAALLAALDRGEEGGEGPCRIAVLDPTPARRDQARRVVERGAAWSGRGGIWFRDRGLAADGARVALLFPGIEAHFAPEVASVARRFEREAPADTRPADLEATGRGVVALGRFLHDVLGDLGVRADAYGGHSIGEWTGMIASGILPDAEVDAFLARVAPGRLEVPGVLFAAAACGVERARAAIDGLRDIAISHDNCPSQVLLCGVEASVAVARERLIADGVLCQVLPFRSGFHSPLFADHVAPHAAHFDALALRAPRVPLWSATTAAPYPDHPDAIRALAVAHLTAPLRFREVVERLYADGFRLFVQVGAGSLPGFVKDTLGDLPHLAIAASEPRRSGLAQVRNLAVALWVEGVSLDLDPVVPRVGSRVSLDLGVPILSLDVAPLVHGSGRAAPPPTDDPVLIELARTMEALTRAGQDVVDAFHARAAPSFSERRALSLATLPDLADHSFFPQPAGWPVASDGYPVVPMTLHAVLLREAARRVAPGEAVAISDLRAHKWLIVEPAQEVTLSARHDGDAVHAAVEGFAEARVHLGAWRSTPPVPSLADLRAPRPTPVDAAALYAERWMFHGPRFQGVIGLGPYDDEGIDGVIRAPGAAGALLDNAGQIFGYWVMATQPRDQLAMPVRIDRITFHGPDPAPGTRVDCRVRIRSCTERLVEADLELSVADRLWCRIDGWTDRRFETDDRTWRVMRQPEWSTLSQIDGEQVVFDGAALRAPSRDWLMRRYLGEAERAELLASPPRAQRWFLEARIAARDAARCWVWARDGERPIFPVEVALTAIDGGFAWAGRTIEVERRETAVVARVR